MVEAILMRYERALAIADRHDRLIKLIQSGDYSSYDLAEQLGVSEQTIYRDIDFLKQRGFAIRSEKHSDGWAYHLLAESASDEKGAPCR
jgi:biotin operon repressor